VETRSGGNGVLDALEIGAHAEPHAHGPAGATRGVSPVALAGRTAPACYQKPSC